VAQRIKGQEVEVLIIADGAPQMNITTVKSFEFTYQMEVASEGYLGETTNRRDSVYKGISGKMELHIENQTILTLANTIIDKARRRIPGAQINIKATLNFPNGQRPRIIISDAEFGELPFNFGSRTDYLAVTVNFEAADAQTLTS